MASKFPEKRASSKEIDAFLDKVNRTPVASTSADSGRLIFAMDATASRERVWDIASHQHAEMFNVVKTTKSLSIQLCYYRGFNEFYASSWSQSADALAREILSVRCLAGRTQISRVLEHALRETRQSKVSALIFVGDCVEESIDRLGQMAGELGIYRVPLFLFQEGNDSSATRAFKHLAQLSGGAHCHFDASSAEQLGVLLSAVAAYASGGKTAMKGLENQNSPYIKALLEQIKD